MRRFPMQKRFFEGSALVMRAVQFIEADFADSFQAFYPIPVFPVIDEKNFTAPRKETVAMMPSMQRAESFRKLSSAQTRAIMIDRMMHTMPHTHREPAGLLREM